MKQRIIVICEGDSEVAYLQQLQSFLYKEAKDFLPLLTFFPVKVGCGYFTNVKSVLRRERQGNRNACCKVWIDYDLYHRNDKRCMTQYRQSRIKPFYFSYHNFEDFLILHCTENIIKQWKDVFESTGHFESPLHDVDYKPHFQTLFPDYQKGRMPLDFISWESLRRLKTNLVNRTMPPSSNDDCDDFATFLIAELENAYPDRLTL